MGGGVNVGKDLQQTIVHMQACTLCAKSLHSPGSDSSKGPAHDVQRMVVGEFGTGTWTTA
jgi:hypothetical protein